MVGLCEHSNTPVGSTQIVNSFSSKWLWKCSQNTLYDGVSRLSEQSMSMINQCKYPWCVHRLLFCSTTSPFFAIYTISSLHSGQHVSELATVNFLKLWISATIKTAYLSHTTVETFLDTNTIRKANTLLVKTSNIKRSLEVEATCLTRRLANHWSIIINHNLTFTETTTHGNRSPFPWLYFTLTTYHGWTCWRI